jgi:hypothetical protein
MFPSLDPRLLPDEAAEDAENVWLYEGIIQGIRKPRLVHATTSGTRSVFRVPKGDTSKASLEDSYWLEFDTIEVSVVKSPVASVDGEPQSHSLYYWASPAAAPMYTTFERIEASDPPLVLGIPAPATAPVLTPAGGIGASTTRAYVYTWVSEFGEEGPPSPATIDTGKIDDTWQVDLTAPTVGDTTDRLLDTVRIYRTVSTAVGSANYYFVTELPIATLTFNDTLLDEEIINAGILESTDFTAPPDTLKGLAMLPNGMLCGWAANEIWFSEPYRPHAWPAKYQVSTEYDIVAMVGAGQTLVIGTTGYPYMATGVSPATITLGRIPMTEPCVSRSSMVGTPTGAYYVSPSGLIFISSTGAVQNTTREIVGKREWQNLLNLQAIRGALLDGAYIMYAGETETAFQTDAFQNDAFQQFDDAGTRQGALVEFQNTRVGFSRLLAEDSVHDIDQDPWSGEVLLVFEDGVYVLDLNSTETADYTWKSKIFSLPKPANLGAIRIAYSKPGSGATPRGRISVLVNGAVKLERDIPAANTVFRMPSGFRGNRYQFIITGNLNIREIQFGSTVRELATI